MRRARAWMGLVAVVGLASLVACGDNGSCPEGQTGIPPNCMELRCPAGQTGTPPDCRPECTQSVLVTGSFGVTARTIIFDNFSVPSDGRLDVTLDWTDPSSPVGFYVVPVGTCTLEEFNARSCNFLVRSEPSSMKPRLVMGPGFSAGNYSWLVSYFGDEQESVSLQIVLSQGGGCPALAGAPPEAAARGTGAGLTVERALRF